VIDGCNLVQSLAQVYLPCCKTAYLSFAIVSLIFTGTINCAEFDINTHRNSFTNRACTAFQDIVDAGPQWRMLALQPCGFSAVDDLVFNIQSSISSALFSSGVK
jgi:hypothetical protein